MSVVVLCLLAALAYGVSDFVGGLASRGVSPWSVAFVGQLGGAVAVLAVALGHDGTPGASAYAWAVGAGVGNGIGTAFLYRGLAAGRMGVVAPVSAVGAALVPVVVGLLDGERPGLTIGLGLAVAFPGVWLVAREPAPPVPGEVDRDPMVDPIESDAGSAPGLRGLTPPGVLDGVVAGLGFGLLFVALARIPEGAGLIPLALNLLVGATVVAVVAGAFGAPWVPRTARSWIGVVSGTLGAAATGLFLLASRDGELSVTSVLVALYPAFTVLLAAALLREQIHRAQVLGLALCALTVGLVAAG